MNTRDLSDTLSTLMHELVRGSPDPTAGTYMLNRGDRGLVDSLDSLTAAAASAPNADGPSIAAHVDHLRYGLAFLNRWANGEDTPWKDADWRASWKKGAVSEAEWRALRDELQREADAWIAALRTPREVSSKELAWIAGSVAHLAYHLGAIRQINRGARGPTAEDERAVEDRLRSESGTSALRSDQSA
jgi:hypothetical protein